MTNVRMKSGDSWPEQGNKGWQDWLFDTFISPNSLQKIFTSLRPAPIFESYQLAIFDPFKPSQRTILNLRIFGSQGTGRYIL